MAKRGLTLIELLVLMVVFSLLLGLLLPGLGRAREEERKTQCRSNMRQIGLAIMTYAGDNGGCWPAMGGPSAAPPTHDKPEESAGEELFGIWQAHYSHWNLVTMPTPHWWKRTPETPAMPTGLGLLWAGGYFKEMNAQLLYCPDSRPGASSAASGVDKTYRYDADEPFWTSGAAVVRSDSDAVGNVTTAHSSLRYHYELECAEDSLRFASWGSRAATPAKWPLCMVQINYTLRNPVASLKKTPLRLPGSGTHYQGYLPNSNKLADVDKAAVVSDSVALLEKRWFYWNSQEWSVHTDLEKMVADAKDYLISNHESAFNLLFADGAVKTYSDDAGKLLRTYCAWKRGYVAQAFRSPTEWGGHKGTEAADAWSENVIWKAYFDGAHQQD